MGTFFQYYFSLDDSGPVAEVQMADAVRLVLSEEERVGDPGARLRGIDENRVSAILDEARQVRTAGGRDSRTDRPAISVDLGPGGFVSAWGDSAPPECPDCGAETDWDPTEWFEGGDEPAHECPDCGFSALIGDWENEQTQYARTHCALVLVDWPDLPQYAPSVHDALLTTVGSRPRYVAGKL